MKETKNQDPEVFNAALALSSVGGDREFFAEVLGLVHAAWPTLLAEIKEGLAQGDLSAVAKKARIAEAAARDVSARRAYQSARNLETSAAKGNLQATQNAVTKLEREVEILQFFLSMFEDSE